MKLGVQLITKNARKTTPANEIQLGIIIYKKIIIQYVMFIDG
jgi:hypothetical protein